MPAGRAATLTLQCGHDPKAVENASRADAPAAALASMRPRPEGRGERDASALIAAPGAASMRPRPEGRGEPRGDGCHVGTEELQCGHDPKAVENLVPPPSTGRDSRLQCGHDPKAVENAAAGAGSTSVDARFNAATTRRPWRTAEQAIATVGIAGFNAATTRRPWRTRSRA